MKTLDYRRSSCTMPELPDVTVCIERLQALAGGKLLADRVMSRVLKDDRPKTLDDLGLDLG